MNVSRISLLMLAASIPGVLQPAEAQHHYSRGYHVDYNTHVVRDRHGHVIGRYHHDVVHRNSRYVVPHSTHSVHHGTYYVQNGGYYYRPQTAVGSSQETARQVEFGAFSHIDDLALRLETLTNELCLDLHYNYFHNFEFDVTYAEAYEILQVARFIHDAEHNQDRDAIRSKLGGMDALFHHVQDDVRGWSRRHYRQIGTLGILSKMDLIESTLHHLMNDVGVHLTDGLEQAPPPVGIEQAPRPSGVSPPPAVSLPRN